MASTKHKDLHQSCLNSRETVQHQFLPAMSMTARSSAEQGSCGREAGRWLAKASPQIIHSFWLVGPGLDFGAGGTKCWSGGN